MKRIMTNILENESGGMAARYALVIGFAVVVAASWPHRAEAFAAARALIDELKATVPIWKHQVFSDGDEEWVGTP